MNIQDCIKVGIVNYEEQYPVVEQHLARHVGSGSARVLATPWMIGFMERTAHRLLMRCLPEGFSSVGTKVDIRHLSRKDIDSFGVSVGAGLGGISGSVSVWSIGSGLNGTYSYTEKDADGNDGATQSQTPVSKNELTFILSSKSDKGSGKEGDPGGEFSKNLGGYPSSQSSLNDRDA